MKNSFRTNNQLKALLKPFLTPVIHNNKLYYQEGSEIIEIEAYPKYKERYQMLSKALKVKNSELRLRKIQYIFLYEGIE